MNKNKIIFICLISLLIIGGIIITYKVINNKNINSEQNNSNMEDNINNEGENMDNIKVIINDKTYVAKLENNETVKTFLSWLPQEYKMQELNGNEKYIYMDKSLPTEAINPKHINKGDIMLYGDNCLVIFYKSFDTSYSYTRVGHIDNLEDLGKDSIIVRFEK